MTDYIDLGPDDVLQDGDIVNMPDRFFVLPKPGMTLKEAGLSEASRPRLHAIRDAAIDLLRWYLYAGASGITSAKFEKLKAAVGLTDEELRGEA